MFCPIKKICVTCVHTEFLCNVVSFTGLIGKIMEPLINQLTRAYKLYQCYPLLAA